MIRILRRTPPAPRPAGPRVLPPRVVPVIPRQYTCTRCDVTGFGDRCWCCGMAMGERT